MAQFEQYDPARHNRDTPQETFGPVIKIDKHEDGRIYVITMNRPHRMNSLGGGLGGALVEAFEQFRDDADARVIGNETLRMVTGREDEHIANEGRIRPHRP